MKDTPIETHLHTKIQKLNTLVNDSQTILILQPDNPDGDSTGTALALEEILGDLGKTAILYSYNQPSTYLRTLEGWDRISQNFPKQYDLAIVVDAGSPGMLLASFEHHGTAISAKPLIVIDHHTSTGEFPGAVLSLIAPVAAAAELVFSIAQQLKWPVNPSAAEKLTSAILSDSLGLTIAATTSSTVRAVADLVDLGANLTDLYRRKREVSVLEPDLLRLKGQLLSQVEYLANGQLAVCVIQPETIAEFKVRHDPGDLVIWEMQWVKGVAVAAVLKHYGTKIKVSMRARQPIADKIATQFDGGGHPLAAAYRAVGTDIDVAKAALVKAFETASAAATEEANAAL